MEIMKIKYSALVSDARGKLNGSVASKNRYGQYLRNKITPVNPQTNHQMAVRGQFGALSSQWSSLTQKQRDSWKTAGEDSPETNIFGDTVILQPNVFFIKRNMLLTTAGLPVIETAVKTTEVEYQNIILSDFTTSAMTLDLEHARFNEGAHKMVVYATRPMSAGREFLKNDYRVIGVLEEADFLDGSAYTKADIFELYVARFGNPIEGSRIGIAVKCVNSTGGVSLPARYSGLVGN